MLKNTVERLIDYRNKNGINGLLPQNLPEDILARMIYEIISIENDLKTTPASSLLMAITMLKKGDEDIDSEKLKVYIEEEYMMENFSIYTSLIRIEDMIRKKIIHIPEDSLPTVENIFDVNREINIIELDKR